MTYDIFRQCDPGFGTNYEREWSANFAYVGQIKADSGSQAIDVAKVAFAIQHPVVQRAG